jgi:hypothetical protein
MLQLRRRFGNRKILLNTLMNGLIYKVPESEFERARHITDFLESHMRQMLQYKIDIKNPDLNRLLLQMYTSKVPSYFLRLWEMEVQEQSEKAAGPIDEDKVDLVNCGACEPIVVDVTISDFVHFMKRKLDGLFNADTARTQAAQALAGARQRMAIMNQETKMPKLRPFKQAARETAREQRQQPRASRPKSRERRVTWRDQTPDRSLTRRSEPSVERVLAVQDAPRPAKAGGRIRKDKRSDSFSRTPISQWYNLPNCIFCNSSEHTFRNCEKAYKLPHDERLGRLRALQNGQLKDGKKVCLICLQEGHLDNACSKTCTVHGCGQRHHRVLHGMDSPAGRA